MLMDHKHHFRLIIYPTKIQYSTLLYKTKTQEYSIKRGIFLILDKFDLESSTYLFGLSLIVTYIDKDMFIGKVATCK